MKPTSACVIVADRHPSLLSALKRLLEPRFEVIAMVDNIVSLIDALEAQTPDSIVMDISMLEERAWHLARHLSRAYPQIPIVLLTSGTDEYELPADMPTCRLVPMSKAAELLGDCLESVIQESTDRSKGFNE